MSAPASPDPVELGSYLQTWADVLAQIIGEITGSAAICAVQSEPPSELPAAAESDLWIVAAGSGALRGEMSIRLSSAATVRLAQTLMNEPPSAAEVSGEHREAALELWRQVGGLATTALKSRWGELQFSFAASGAAPSWPASFSAWLRVGEESTAASLVEIQVSAALAAALRTETPSASEAEVQPASSPPPSAPSAPVAPLPPHDDRVNLDLLMDVELAVTLRFGSRRLLLREVLDLNTGSVVDLDRQVQEPIDMLLDGRVVARGEIIVLDGNYGLRVTEVAPAGNP